MTDGNPNVTLDTLHDDLGGLRDDLGGLRAETREGLSSLRTEMGEGLSGLRTEMGEGFSSLRTEMGEGFSSLRTEMREGFSSLRAEMRAGFTDMKVTLVTGFAGLPTRESSEEMIRLLREGNRLNEDRFTQLDARIREQHLETQQALRALVEGQLGLTTEVKGMSVEMKRLIARIDAIIRGRNNGEPA